MFKKFYKQFIFFLVISSMIILISGNISGAVHDVYPSMTRTEIQALVDSASDGDTIFFHAGTYDWSDTPLAERVENIGAINIIDKTLTIKGEEGAILIGRESEHGTTMEARGVNAFHIKDLDTNNDVTFDGLTFQTFLRGVRSGYIVNYPHPPEVDDISIPNLRNLTVKNCIFLDIHRDAVSIGHIGGNVLIQNNDMSADRWGFFLSWYWSEGHMAWQPEDTYIRFLENNISAGFGGLGIWQTTNVIVKQNIIECETKGINMGYTRNGAVISDNSLANCLYGISIFGYWRYEGEFEAKGAVVEKNKLYDITHDGIRFYGDACYENTVSKNEIHMAPISITGIYSVGHDNYYGQNKISGSGWIAFCLGHSGSSIIPYNETLQANNVNQYTPTEYWHYYLHFGTHDNLIIGSGMGHNTYVDNGYNNRIIGVTPMAGGIGQELSDAINERNEELKEAREIDF